MQHLPLPPPPTLPSQIIFIPITRHGCPAPTAAMYLPQVYVGTIAPPLPLCPSLPLSSQLFPPSSPTTQIHYHYETRTQQIPTKPQQDAHRYLTATQGPSASGRPIQLIALEISRTTSHSSFSPFSGTRDGFSVPLLLVS